MGKDLPVIEITGYTAAELAMRVKDNVKRGLEKVGDVQVRPYGWEGKKKYIQKMRFTQTKEERARV